MSAAERRAQKLFNEYHLDDEDFEVKRNLMILLLKTESFLPVNVCNYKSVNMSNEDISARLSASDADILSGNVMACDEVHHNIESKCPWL